MESVIILLVLLVGLGAWQARIHAASVAAAQVPYGVRPFGRHARPHADLVAVTVLARRAGGTDGDAAAGDCCWYGKRYLADTLAVRLGAGLLNAYLLGEHLLGADDLGLAQRPWPPRWAARFGQRG